MKNKLGMTKNNWRKRNNEKKSNDFYAKSNSIVDYPITIDCAAFLDRFDLSVTINSIVLKHGNHGNRLPISRSKIHSNKYIIGYD